MPDNRNSVLRCVIPLYPAYEDLFFDLRMLQVELSEPFQMAAGNSSGGLALYGTVYMVHDKIDFRASG